MKIRPTTMAPARMASPGAGTFRIALAGVIALLVSRGWSLPEAGPAYLAAGLAAIFGVLLIWGRPAILMREKLAHTALDSVLVGVLVAGTGGESSPFCISLLRSGSRGSRPPRGPSPRPQRWWEVTCSWSSRRVRRVLHR